MLLIVFCFTLLTMVGCGEKILIDGKYYSILSAEEELAMIEFARQTLTSKSNNLPIASELSYLKVVL